MTCRELVVLFFGACLAVVSLNTAVQAQFQTVNAPVSSINVGQTVNLNGEQFVKVNDNGLLMMTSTFSCPHGKKIAHQWVECHLCDNDEHGYYNYNTKSCACYSGYNYRSSDTKCLVCPANSNWYQAGEVCQCNANYYMQGDNEMCLSCPENSSSKVGSTQITDCLCGIGHQVDPETEQCLISGVYSSVLDAYYDDSNCSNPVAWMDEWNGCSSLATIIAGESVTEQELAAKTVCLVDSRDHRSYRVRRFDDDGVAGESAGDKCWMIDSLKYGGDYGLKDACTWNNGYSDLSITGNYVGRCRAIDSTYDNYLYSWQAALQSTSRDSLTGTTQGICPTGWHVPSGNNSGEFATLASRYGTSSQSFWLEASKADFKLSGHADRSSSGALSAQGSSGEYWTSTPTGSGGAYNLGLSSSSVYSFSASYANVDWGYSVRCVKD